MTETIPCSACGSVNAFELSACGNCGESLSTAKLNHSIGELQKTTQRMRDLTTPRKTFYSFNGCGTMLLDYLAQSDGTYQAVRWVTVFGFPLVPLGAYKIEPTSQTINHGEVSSSFNVVDRVPLSTLRILRTYLLAALGVAPIIIGSLNSSTLNHVLGGPKAFLAMLLAIAWGIYIVFFRLKNDSKAYKKKTAG